MCVLSDIRLIVTVKALRHARVAQNLTSINDQKLQELVALKPPHGDSMILAECIFSQSATGEVSSAYFRKLAISPEVGCANFRKRGPNRPTPTSNARPYAV